MQLYRLFATCRCPSEKRREYTGIVCGSGGTWSVAGAGLPVVQALGFDCHPGAQPSLASQLPHRHYSSFFISPASAANGLWVALAIFGLLVELSEKYC